MKRILCIFMSLFFLLSLFSFPTYAAAEEITYELSDAELKIKKQNELIVLYNEEKDANVRSTFSIDPKVKSTKKISSKIEVIEVNENDNIDDIINEYKKDPSIKSIEKNKILQTHAAPNDTYYSSQWGIRDINFESIWNLNSIAKKSATVAVIDSGIQTNHPDLANRIASGGRDFYKNTTSVADQYGHGTAVSSVIVAQTNNLKGIAGMAGMFNIKILPLKVASPDGKNYVSDVIEAINYAITKKVDIINLSMGSSEPGNAENEVIQNAIRAGITVIASSGNDETNIYNYPASYDNVISVGATKDSDNIASFSTFNDKVDVVAPGVNITTCYIGGEYISANGTSFSAPMVSGLAAVLKSVNPILTPAQIANILTSTATDKGVPGKDIYFGHGKVDAFKAFNVALSSTVASVNLNKTNLAIEKGSSEIITATVLPETAFNKNVTWTSSNNTVATVDQTGKITANAKGTATITVNTTDGNFKSSCVVTVTDILVKEISVNPLEKSLIIGQNLTLTANVLPQNATNKTISWSSDNTNVATVNQSTGVVTAVSAGIANITAKAVVGNVMSNSAKFIVVNKPIISVQPNLPLNSRTVLAGSNQTAASIISSLPKTYTLLNDNGLGEAVDVGITWSSTSVPSFNINPTADTSYVFTGTLTNIPSYVTFANGISKTVTYTVLVKHKKIVSVTENLTTPIEITYGTSMENVRAALKTQYGDINVTLDDQTQADVSVIWNAKTTYDATNMVNIQEFEGILGNSAMQIDPQNPVKATAYIKVVPSNDVRIGNLSFTAGGNSINIPIIPNQNEYEVVVPVDAVPVLLATTHDQNAKVIDLVQAIAVPGNSTFTIQAQDSTSQNYTIKFIRPIKKDPTITWPSITFVYTSGLKLSDIQIPDGFAWLEPNTVLSMPGGKFSAVYTPSDTYNYNIITKDIDLVLESPFINITTSNLNITIGSTFIINGSTNIPNVSIYILNANNEIAMEPLSVEVSGNSAKYSFSKKIPSTNLKEGTYKVVAEAIATDQTKVVDQITLITKKASGGSKSSGNSGGGGGGYVASTPTPTPSATPTPTPTATPSSTPTPTPTATPSSTPTPTAPVETKQLYSIPLDISDELWAKEYIQDVIDKEIMTGYIEDGGKIKFKPKEFATRAEFATALFNYLGLKKDGNKSFEDTKAHWANDYIAKLVSEGIMTGNSDIAFGPDELVTREQIATILYRAFKLPNS